MNENSKPTQNELVLNYMREFGSITQLEAIVDLGVMRLASRVSDLRKKGYNIISDWVAVKNRREENSHIKRYRLVEEQT